MLIYAVMKPQARLMQAYYHVYQKWMADAGSFAPVTCVKNCFRFSHRVLVDKEFTNFHLVLFSFKTSCSKDPKIELEPRVIFNSIEISILIINPQAVKSPMFERLSTTPVRLAIIVVATIVMVAILMHVSIERYIVFPDWWWIINGNYWLLLWFI